MATNTLDQPVQVNDLILAYNTKKCYMLLVKIAPDNQQTYPFTSSVFVQKVNWHVPDLEGYWVLDGPSVYYSHYDTEDEDYKYCLCDKHSNSNPETRLDLFLYSMASTDDKQGSHANRGFTLIVKPHGRDVLKHYFNGWCPNCGDEGWFCPGCGPVEERFPDIGGSCAVDQSCPMCMGYDFALNDKAWIAEIEDIEDRRYNWKDGRPELVDDDSLDRLRDEAVESKKERYEAINARRQRMGMAPVDLDDLLEECKDMFVRE